MTHKELLIQKIKEYISLSPAEEQLIGELFTPLSLAKGDTLLREGAVCKYMYFIVSGLLRHYINYEGKELTVYFNAENSFAFDVQSFLSQTPTNKTIVTLEDTQLLAITYADLQRFYREVSQGERFGRLLMEHYFIDTVSHITSGLVDTPEQKYLRFLSVYKPLIQRLNLKDIASFVGVTPQSLSRIRNRMARS